MSGDDPYVYPGTTVLRNKLGIKNADALNTVERLYVDQRAAQGVPTGGFDLAHLRAIHGHLFQDVYEWAGQVRTVEISKGGHQFQFRRYIETGIADVHRRIVSRGYLQGLAPAEFAKVAAEIVGDVNYVHPFREGNGRAQFQYLRQLGEQAGHDIALRRIAPDAWRTASREAHDHRFEPMAACIAGALVERQQERSRADYWSQKAKERAADGQPERDHSRDKDSERER